MTWTFIYLMVLLKIPIGCLLYIVWWAARQSPEPAGADDDGGSRNLPAGRSRFPRPPRRGPHGAPPPPPPRVRTHAFARRRTHHR
ncbi:MAG TPA: hypothetical protein VHE14_03240 [Solirubrobacteraceae bacterium]|nr:hypothetical protein [Solirubrobacteraceae bacterium]